jgi:3-oxoacyl-[acyl-carrier protein] reductase
MAQLKNRLALITGGSSGIGAATAELFAKNGADLALVDISSKVIDFAQKLQTEIADQHQLGTRIRGYICDVTVSEQIEEVFNRIAQDFANHQCPNVVVNCAGIVKFKSIVEMSDMDFERVLDVHLKGTFSITRAACKRLVEQFPNAKFDNPLQSYASIINVSSTTSNGIKNKQLLYRKKMHIS